MTIPMQGGISIPATTAGGNVDLDTYGGMSLLGVMLNAAAADAVFELYEGADVTGGTLKLKFTLDISVEGISKWVPNINFLLREETEYFFRVTGVGVDAYAILG